MTFPMLGRRLPGPPREKPSWALVAPRDLFSSPHPADWESQCRRMAFNAYLGDGTVMCRILARFKMYVSTRDEGLGPHLIGDGYWEMWNTRAVIQIVQPGMVCVDAGANLGYFTVLMADLVYPGGKVVAAEPVPATRNLLQRNVAINGFGATVDVLAVAFGARAGEVTLYMPPGEPKNAQICDAPPHPDWESVKAPVRPIDDLGLPRVDFIKIDVEGAEIDVWRGLKTTLDANPQIQILMEVNCGRYRQEASAFLADIAARFPLRFVDFSGERLPITADQVMAATDDVMLYLAKA